MQNLSIDRSIDGYDHECFPSEESNLKWYAVDKATYHCVRLPPFDPGSETPKIGKSKKAAAAQATVEAMKADMDDLFNRVEALAASSRRREKAQVVKDRTTVLAGQMELNRIQVHVLSHGS